MAFILIGPSYSPRDSPSHKSPGVSQAISASAFITFPPQETVGVYNHMEEFNREKALEEKGRIAYTLHRNIARCFHCGTGHKEMHKDKVKVNGNPQPVCEECYKIFQDKE